MKPVNAPRAQLPAWWSSPAFICLVLIAATLVSYWRVLHADFLNYDDPEYVTDNPFVRQGLTWAVVRWALTTAYFSYWHPLTWLSHALDCQLFGLAPAGHHAVSLLFHLANTMLLFLLLRQMTDALWRSAFVAALFALHPIHVESVAWIAERKDVLSTFFGLLSLWAYASYAKAEGRMQNAECKARVSRFTFHVSRFYLLSLLLFACSLMSKPMLVTLPFLLLLLDCWPLQRLKLSTLSSPPSAVLSTPRSAAEDGLRRTGQLSTVLEKLPFLALALASCVVTFVAQHRGGVLPDTAVFPLDVRLGNAAVAYVRYLRKTFWPSDLAVFYPYAGWPAWEALGAGLVLLVMTALVLKTAVRRPYLAVGWLWFLGTLVPVIGLVQSGGQSMADRYSYLSLTGIFIMVVWAIGDFMRHQPALVVIGGLVVMTSLAITTTIQVCYWQTSLTLFQHALAVTDNNAVAHHNLADALFRQGRLAEAKSHYETALTISPESAITLCNLGVILTKEGRTAEARQFYDAALQLKPGLPQARYHLALLDAAEGRRAAAILHWRRVLQSKPHWADALNNLAWLLATSPEPDVRNGSEAVGLAERACALAASPTAANFDTLAAAYAETGRFAEAVTAMAKAVALAQATGRTNLLTNYRARLQLYQQGQPYHGA